MKICYVSNNFEIHDYRFLKKLVENNYDVHAVSLRKNQIDDNFKIAGINYYEFYKTRKVYQKRFRGLNPIWYFAARKYLRRIIQDIKPDIVHGGYASISGFIAAFSGFHPFLLMPWGSDILTMPAGSTLTKKLVSYSIKHSDMITCDAESVKDKIVREYAYHKDNIVVFPWGIDLNVFNPGNDARPSQLLGLEGKNVVVCTRQHKPIYGIKYLLEAIPLVLASFDNTHFLFIGSGPLTAEYEKIAMKLGIGESIKFVGNVANETLPHYLNNSDIYVSPSLSDGSSLSLMEALACGLPVVATNIKANQEWISKDVGLLCKKKDAKDLANAIASVLSDDMRKQSFGKSALKVAQEKADWDKNFQKLEDIYRVLVQL